MNAILVLFLAAAMLAASYPAIADDRADAQEVQDTQDTLTIGWSLAPPAFQVGPEGEHSGYFIEFAKLLGEAIGKNVQVRLYDSFGELVRAQISGETQLLAGAPELGVLGESNVFSRAVGTSRYMLFGLAARLGELAPSEDRSMRVSALTGRPAAVSRFLERQVEVPISSSGEGLFALLSRDIDAVLYPEELAQGWSYRAGLDHLVLPIGEPIVEVRRVVVLHNSRAALLPSINDAIARLEADGSLPQLRQKYLMQHFEPEPDMLTVAVPEIVEGLEFAPYFLQDEDGQHTGFAIELFHELATSAGLNYRFEVTSFANMAQGPSAAGVDIVPLFALPTDSQGFADHTIPTEELLVTATVLSSASSSIQSLEDLSGHKVGVIADTFAHHMAMRDETLEVMTFKPGDPLLDALLVGSVDAVLETRGYISSRAERRGLAAQVWELDPEFYRFERGILLRFGLGKVREELNSAISSYMLSNDYIALRQKYFDAPVFWTEKRQRIVVAGLGAAAMLTLAFGSALIMSDRARRRATSAHREAKLAQSAAEQAGKEAEDSRRQAEERASETLDATSQLRAMMEAAQSGILGLNRYGQILIANPVARHMIGIDEISAPIDWPRDVNFCHTNHAQPLINGEGPLNRALSGNQLAGEVFRMQTGVNGRVRSVRLTSSSLPRETSLEIAIVLVIDDVTEQERNRARVERYDRLSMVGQLTGGVAHDFNNLLAVILSRQELLRDEISDAALVGHVDASIDAASRGADLTRSMLAFARKAPLQPRKLDVNKMVEDTRELTARTIASNITMKTVLAKNLSPIQVDAAAAESALLNLILNARDAMSDGGTLTIKTYSVEIAEGDAGLPDTIQAGPYIVVSVTDTGLGISADNLPHIFDPFFTTKAPGQGSGLGLSMIQGFMEQSGGGALVSSEPGQGTTFQLYFPAQSALLDDEPSLPTGDVLDATGQRILLVEDNTEVLKVLETMLCNAGYAVTSAVSGDLAAAIFDKDPSFDLLLTDVMMPGNLDGLGLAAALRQRVPELPVITMSGYTDAYFTAYSAGNGNLQLSKPVSRSNLLSAVSQALKGAVATPS